jgi:Flp pilus assembly protein TadD
VLHKSGDHAGARVAFTTALALAPAAAGIWSNAAGNELDAGNAAESQRLAGKRSPSRRSRRRLAAVRQRALQAAARRGPSGAA